jgi:hypothetical protein
VNIIYREAPINLLVEGLIDEVVAKRLLVHVGLVPGKSFGRSGKANLLARLPNYNQAARHRIWFVMIDLDNDAVCASQAIARWLPAIEEGMMLRVAVKAVEAWLMADIESMAAFLDVSPSLFPGNPDREANPKEKLVNIARHSTNTTIRNDFVPRQGSGTSEGPGYATLLNDFTENYWHPEEARQRSDSLHRCINALSAVKGTILE